MHCDIFSWQYNLTGPTGFSKKAHVGYAGEPCQNSNSHASWWYAGARPLSCRSFLRTSQLKCIRLFAKAGKKDTIYKQTGTNTDQGNEIFPLPPTPTFFFNSFKIISFSFFPLIFLLISILSLPSNLHHFILWSKSLVLSIFHRWNANKNIPPPPPLPLCGNMRT